LEGLRHNGVEDRSRQAHGMSRRGHISVPAEVRRKLEVGPGCVLVWE